MEKVFKKIKTTKVDNNEKVTCISYLKSDNKNGLRVILNKYESGKSNFSVMDGSKELEKIELKNASMVATVGTIEELVEKYF